jgi:hypothetical protein
LYSVCCAVISSRWARASSPIIIGERGEWVSSAELREEHLLERARGQGMASTVTRQPVASFSNSSALPTRGR